MQRLRLLRVLLPEREMDTVIGDAIGVPADMPLESVMLGQVDGETEAR